MKIAGLNAAGASEEGEEAEAGKALHGAEEAEEVAGVPEARAEIRANVPRTAQGAVNNIDDIKSRPRGSVGSPRPHRRSRPATVPPAPAVSRGFLHYSPRRAPQAATGRRSRRMSDAMQ